MTNASSWRLNITFSALRMNSQMTPLERLARMRRTFEKSRAVLVEDYEHFTTPPVTPDAPKSQSKARRKSAKSSAPRSRESS